MIPWKYRIVISGTYDSVDFVFGFDDGWSDTAYQVMIAMARQINMQSGRWGPKAEVIDELTGEKVVYVEEVNVNGWIQYWLVDRTAYYKCQRTKLPYSMRR